MEISYHGGNCVSLTAKKVTVVVDDNLASLGGRSVATKANIALFTQKRLSDGKAAGFVIDGPGEYEISEVSIIGLATRAHTDHEEEHSAVIYKVIMRGITAVILGHIHPELTDEQLEKLGTVDVLIIPVGGGGYTLDAKSAAKLIREIEPKVIVPTHFAEDGLKFEVPQVSVEDFFKEVGATPEKLDILKLKSELLPIDAQAYYLIAKS